MLFSWVGLFIAIYILIGVFFNTAPPHLPKAAFNLAAVHSWVVNGQVHGHGHGFST
jgi:hypothetical protein